MSPCSPWGMEVAGWERELTPSHLDSDQRDQSDNPPCVPGTESRPTRTLELLTS